MKEYSHKERLKGYLVDSCYCGIWYGKSGPLDLSYKHKAIYKYSIYSKIRLYL